MFVVSDRSVLSRLASVLRWFFRFRACFLVRGRACVLSEAEI